jgi:uroporphyrinogen decarboxylase
MTSWNTLRTEFLRKKQVFPSIKNDLLLRTCRKETLPGEEIPVWMMRQAGRYLPEFRSKRAENDFVKVCRDPNLASEVTIQPFRRFSQQTLAVEDRHLPFNDILGSNLLDAVIVFSDILTIPNACGQNLEMIPGRGPVLTPYLCEENQESFNFEPDIEISLGYVFDAIFATRSRLDSAVPVIGFSGAPWTLLSYMVEGGGSKTWAKARTFLYSSRKVNKILDQLTDCVVQYLVKQYDAGASMLQVFETNAGELPPDIYREICFPLMKRIASDLRRMRPEAILAVFPKDYLYIEDFEESDFDVVGVSWKDSLARCSQLLPSKVLQGNLDPAILLTDDKSVIANKVARMLSEKPDGRYIANLGHGMMPEMTPKQAFWFLESLKHLSK